MCRSAVSVPRGTFFHRTPSQLSILSYNLLAPLYVRPSKLPPDPSILLLCSIPMGG